MLQKICLFAFFFTFLFYGLPGISGETYLEETFEDGDAWKQRWVYSKAKSNMSEFKLSSGKFYGDFEKDKGLQTSQDAKFYAISRKFDKTFNNEGKKFVV